MVFIRYNNEDKNKIIQWLKDEEKNRFGEIFTDSTVKGERIFTYADHDDRLKFDLVSDVFYNYEIELWEKFYKYFCDFAKVFSETNISGSYLINERYSSQIVKLDYKPGDNEVAKTFMTLCENCGKEIPKDNAFIADESLYSGYCCFSCAFEDYLINCNDSLFDEETEEVFWDAFYENWEDVITTDNAESVLENIPEEQEEAISIIEEFIEENC